MAADKPIGMRRTLQVFAAGAAVLAFSASPLMRYADPVEIWTFGIALASMIIINLIEDEEANSPLGIVTTRVVGYGTICLIVWWSSDWTSSAKANDRRCLAIQGDMLSAQPRRADGPDLFQALGCRPQGEGSVHAPPDRTGKSLMNGR